MYRGQKYTQDKQSCDSNLEHKSKINENESKPLLFISKSTIQALITTTSTQFGEVF